MDMRFLVQAQIFDTLAGQEADRQLRSVVGPQIQRVMESGKVKEAGFLTDRRGAFFVVDIDEAEELYELFGPEIFGHGRLEVSPVAPIERVGEIFEQWGQEGR